MSRAYVLIGFLMLPWSAIASEVVIGSKAFTEGYLLGELLAQTIEKKVPVERRFGMGGTGILFQALATGEIHLYPEYTGTISETILKRPDLRSLSEIRRGLEPFGFVISDSLGFNNTYALAVPRKIAEARGLKSISDLMRGQSHLRAGFSHEFMTREDGFKSLTRVYQLDLGANVRSMEHSLAYEAMSKGEVDLVDVYSTDAKIEKLDLKVLKDDLHFFPEYQAVILARKDFAEKNPKIWALLKSLEGTLDETKMIRLNSHVDLKRESFSAVIQNYLGTSHGAIEGVFMQVLRRTKEHLVLVGLSLLFSLAAGLPLGIIAARHGTFGQVILLLSGIVQTIPSLALLCFLIPVFGIGEKPALAALFLYGLLPIVLNTFVGIRSIEPSLMETAKALRLNSWQRLRLVEVPLASRSILAGVKTSVIISIGTATLAALIGAGGYGVPIVTGLAVNEMNTILLGAIPAAVMAFAGHILFEGLERLIIPKGLRIS